MAPFPPVASFIGGLIAGLILNQIIPIEYKFWREEQKQIDEWYAETLSILNQIGINLFILLYNIEKNEVTEENIESTEEFEKYETLRSRLAEQTYGAPRDKIKNSISSNLNRIAVLKARGMADEENIERQLRVIQILTMSTIDEIENETDLFSSNILKEMEMDSVDSLYDVVRKDIDLE